MEHIVYLVLNLNNVVQYPLIVYLVLNLNNVVQYPLCT